VDRTVAHGRNEPSKIPAAPRIIRVLLDMAISCGCEMALA
jgi:hypothetical protein